MSDSQGGRGCPEVDALVSETVAKLAPFTDGPDRALDVARRFARAVRESAGEAALEIGVRAGGMSAAFCHLGVALRNPPIMVMSVDPWGCAPYFEAGRDVSGVLDYGEQHYHTARALLGRFSNNMLFRLDADTFLNHLLPHLRWWREHVEYPGTVRFLAFVYLDGRHDAPSVLNEVIRVLPYLATHACIVVDNVDKCLGVEPVLRGLDPLLRVELLGRDRLALTWLPAG